jgi:NAD(P)-dependent dehydrogenase (short-subunit alcohol dehydrogenase family)
LCPQALQFGAPFAQTPMLEAMTAGARDPARMQAACMAAAPLNRLARPIDVARTIWFLASDESVFTIGAEMITTAVLRPDDRACRRRQGIEPRK